MIVFKNEGAKVTAELKAANGWIYYFTYATAGGNDHAFMLKESLSKKLCDTLQGIREEAYEQGWADAKAKRKKCTWFSRWF